MALWSADPALAPGIPRRPPRGLWRWPGRGSAGRAGAAGGV